MDNIENYINILDLILIAVSLFSGTWVLKLKTGTKTIRKILNQATQINDILISEIDKHSNEEKIIVKKLEDNNNNNNILPPNYLPITKKIKTRVTGTDLENILHDNVKKIQNKNKIF